MQRRREICGGEEKEAKEKGGKWRRGEIQRKREGRGKKNSQSGGEVRNVEEKGGK